MNLPAALQRLTETVDRFVARQELFNDEQRQSNSNALNRFDRMEGDVSHWKRDYFEGRVVARSEAIPLGMGMKFVRNLPFGELTEIALAAANGEALTSDLKSFMDADLVIVADDNGEAKYLAVEISYTAAPRDTRRAIRNARVLSEQTGHVSIPFIASVRNTHEVQDEVDAGQVYWHQLPDRDSQDEE